MNIEILGKFYDNHSLSIINRNLASQLSKIIDEVFITPLDTFNPQNKLSKEELVELEKLKDNTGEPDIQIRHTYPPIFRWPISKKTKVIFIQPWEFSRVPMEWQYKWEQFADAIITPSNWTREIILNAGINPDKCFVVPNGYNPKIFNKNKEDNLGFVNNNKLIFCYIGCSQQRKGIDILLNAWIKVFNKADNVQLFIKDTPSIYGTNNLINEIIRLQYEHNCGEIIYNDDMLYDTELANIYKHSDILIHPFRGEGFGMHIQEAMACGCFPLISAGGAPNDFVNDSCGLFINTNKVLTDLTNPQLFAIKPGDSLTGMGNHAWILEPEVDDLANKMKGIYISHNRQEIINKVNNATLFTWKESTKKLFKICKQINKNEYTQRFSR